MSRLLTYKYFVAFVCVLLTLFSGVFSKTYTRCQLAEELYHVHHIPLDQVATWVCIAKHTSNFNTKITNHLIGYGIFGIGSKYWCSLKDQKKSCNVKCADLENDDITNDVDCIKIIYDKTKQINGDGYLAWDAYKSICKFDPQISTYVKGCNLAKGNTYLIYLFIDVLTTYFYF